MVGIANLFSGFPTNGHPMYHGPFDQPPHVPWSGDQFLLGVNGDRHTPFKGTMTAGHMKCFDHGTYVFPGSISVDQSKGFRIF